MIASTPTPPYYAVIFSNTLRPAISGYAELAQAMEELARKQPGFLGFETARDTFGISVSYWQDKASIRAWKQNSQHLFAQDKGREEWYATFKVRICLVQNDYEFP